MSKRDTIQFVCANCGAKSLTWSGRCYQCGEWNTLEQDITNISSTASNHGNILKTDSVAKLAKADTIPRLVTGISEMDTVLGGGFVAGSVTLIAGQPGIGKSTLLLQVANEVAKNASVLYVSGEESAHQIGLRAMRLSSGEKTLQMTTSNSTDDIVSTIADGKYQLVVIDSVQTITASNVGSSAGSVAQITNSTQMLAQIAKLSHTAIVLVGHVTKEGSIAGPKVLEHVVDVVLQLEGDRYGGFKLLRGVKNRYGSTNETGIFEMSDNGLRPVTNPSASLLAERQITDGSVVLATMEGTRPLLVEVQALVNRTNYGYPKRAASGVDLNRINVLIAMLERRTKLNLADQDVYINIVGGMRISEPAADLAVCMAIASAFKGMKLKKNAVVFGETGLSGEVRHVPFVEKRLIEAKKLGFDGAIGPIIKSGQKLQGLFGVTDVKSALNQFLEKD